jgi:hypothetical protein
MMAQTVTSAAPVMGLRIGQQPPDDELTRRVASQPGSGASMGEQTQGQDSIVTFPRSVDGAPADENAAQIIDLLQEHLRLAREGRLRSVAVVSVSADGAAIGTQWSCAYGDSASLIGKLTVLVHDLMAARR